VVIEGKLEGDLEVADKLEIRSAATPFGRLENSSHQNRRRRLL